MQGSKNELRQRTFKLLRYNMTTERKAILTALVIGAVIGIWIAVVILTIARNTR